MLGGKHEMRTEFVDTQSVQRDLEDRRRAGNERAANGSPDRDPCHFTNHYLQSCFQCIDHVIELPSTDPMYIHMLT